MSVARTLPSTGRRVVGASPLKLAWWLGPALALLVLATPARADVTLVMVRLGEKPDLGLGQLSCQGLNRALALPEVLLAKFGKPDALFAPDPGALHQDVGRPYNYIRPLATIEPTAIRLGLPVDTRFGLEQEARLEDELLDRRHDGQLLVVAWEHNLLVKMARQLMTRRGGDPHRIPDWPREDFDSIFVLSVPTSGKPTFRIDHEGLDGQSPICPAPAAPVPKRAIIDVGMVDAAVRDEAVLNRRADCVVATPDAWFAVDEGDAPLLVTAPHVTRPFREGAYRFEDGGGTGALARALHRLSGATALYTVDASPSDPNYYDDNEFKQTVERLIGSKRPKLLLDIHASHSNRPYDVDLGTMNGASLHGHAEWLARLVDALHAEGLANLSLDYFPAAKQQSLTKFAAARDVPAIQLEINSTWLHPASNELGAHRFAQLLQALVRFTAPIASKAPTKAAAVEETDLAALRCTSRLPAAR